MINIRLLFIGISLIFFYRYVMDNNKYIINKKYDI